MFTVGTKLKRNINDAIVTIDKIVDNKKGVLYTVKYESGQFRRYYSWKLIEQFTVIEDTPQIDVSNVVFFDFKYKVRMNYKTWLDWRAS